MYTPAEQLIGELSSVRGTDEVGPVSSRTGRIAVYIRCYGEDLITIEIPDVATFTQRCLLDAEDPGTRNTMDVPAGQDLMVKGSAEDANLWAIAVTVIDARTETPVP